MDEALARISAVKAAIETEIAGFAAAREKNAPFYDTRVTHETIKQQLADLSAVVLALAGK